MDKFYTLQPFGGFLLSIYYEFIRELTPDIVQSLLFSNYPDDFARKAHVTGVQMFTKEIHTTDKTILTFHT